VIAGIGVILGIRQLKQLSASGRSDANQRLTIESFDVLSVREKKGNRQRW
jgi:hypothetical protein